MESTAKIPIAIAEDSLLFAEALKSLLMKQGNTEVLFMAENGNLLLKNLEEYQPKVILMDIRMPELDGLEATQKVKELYPNIYVIILANYDDIQTVKYALKTGADGYLTKDINAEELQRAIKKVAAGETYICDSINKSISPYFSNQKV